MLLLKRQRALSRKYRFRKFLHGDGHPEERFIFMKHKFMVLFIFVPGVALISGCASVSATREMDDIKRQVASRTKMSTDWRGGTSEHKEIAEKIQSILKDKLTVDMAVEIALLNNPSLQAVFEDLGIAKADLVKAGLPQNPTVHSFMRSPSHEGKTNIEIEVEQNILDILVLPLRKRLASAQIEQVKFNVGQAVLELDNEVRSAYYTLQAAKQLYTMQEKILKAAESAVELAERQLKAGNINDLILTGHQLALYQVKTNLIQNEAEVSAAHEELARLMGLSGHAMSWDIVEDLPYISKEESSLEELEAKAMTQNFDLAAARQEVKIRQRALGLNRMQIIPDIQAGFNTERETDGERLSGPAFAVEVPLFDQKQSGVARSKAQLRQGQARLKAKEDEIRAELRSQYAKLRATRKLIETYKGTVIPLHAQLIDSLQKHYNYMLVGVYDLLDAKKEEVEAIRQFLDSLKNYWIIRSDLERLAGERLTFIPEEDAGSSTESPKDTKAEKMQHHEHGGH